MCKIDKNGKRQVQNCIINITINETIKVADPQEAQLFQIIKEMASMVAETGEHDYGDFRKSLLLVKEELFHATALTESLLARY